MRLFSGKRLCLNFSYGYDFTMIDFRGSHYPKSVVLFAVTFYLRYPVSYRDLEEIMAERGVDVDHASLNRWVVTWQSALCGSVLAQNEANPSLRHFEPATHMIDAGPST
ncbi:hypothetical protein AN476_18955 [Phaeobacter sp. 11ANDIMAR09]|nr:hypothetical protein AN476_18955 [Phaeobacter sp. 11ANDIMAR09]